MSGFSGDVTVCDAISINYILRLYVHVFIYLLEYMYVYRCHYKTYSKAARAEVIRIFNVR